MINLEWLRTFRAVYRTKSLSKASEMLSISQPTVSQQLSNLEGHLGQKLFTRKSKGVLETNEGKLLNTLVSGSIESLEEIEYFIVQKNSPLKTINTIGISQHLYKTMLSDSLLKIGEYVHVQFGTKQSLITDVEEGRLLYAIIPDEIDTFDIISKTLWQQELVLVATPDISLAEVLDLYPNSLEEAEKRLSRNTWYAHDAHIGYIKLFWMHVFNKKRPAIIPNVVVPNEYEVLHQLSKRSGLSVALDTNSAKFEKEGLLTRWKIKSVPFRKIALISNKKKSPKELTDRIYRILSDLNVKD